MNADSIRSRAEFLDAEDSLRSFRDEFYMPVDESGQPLVYLVGNSLGLQPRGTTACVGEMLERWQRDGVRGHFSGDFPWMPYHEFLTAPMARLVGALDEEVVMMNSLTTNLHLMLATFYRPDGKRRRIMVEGHAFPSDHYALESQLRWHGLHPETDLVVLHPEPGCEHLETDAICEQIERNADQLAMIVLPGVQYYTGQVFDIPELTRTARQNGVPVGFDLAHAAGNLQLQLHEWGPDFAVWCSYKYLNSGPGSTGGCFIHLRHVARTDLPRLAGWWGHDKSSRFRMENEFRPIPTAEGWQLSNPPILSLAAIRASLDVFARAGGMEPLVAKSARLTGFLVELLKEYLAGAVEIITPEPRGCQVSMKVASSGLSGREVKAALDAAGMETDWREPNVIRAAPVPLYNSFSDVAGFVICLAKVLGMEVVNDRQ